MSERRLAARGRRRSLRDALGWIALFLMFLLVAVIGYGAMWLYHELAPLAPWMAEP
jgi:hypothetical protein